MDNWNDACKLLKGETVDGYLIKSWSDGDQLLESLVKSPPNIIQQGAQWLRNQVTGAPPRSRSRSRSRTRRRRASTAVQNPVTVIPELRTHVQEFFRILSERGTGRKFSNRRTERFAAAKNYFEQSVPADLQGQLREYLKTPRALRINGQPLNVPRLLRRRLQRFRRTRVLGPPQPIDIPRARRLQNIQDDFGAERKAGEQQQQEIFGDQSSATPKPTSPRVASRQPKPTSPRVAPRQPKPTSPRVASRQPQPTSNVSPNPSPRATPTQPKPTSNVSPNPSPRVAAIQPQPMSTATSKLKTLAPTPTRKPPGSAAA